MAEDFELVRSYRQHLKRGAASLEAGRYDDALREVEQSLALDPHSVPAQALRERICAARARTAPPLPESAVQPGKGFVPYGVNAASWRGFEQRITDRRVRALLDTANSAIVAGDAVTARVALAEARELKPDATGLEDLEARLSATPVAPPPEAVPAARIWMRAIGAAAMFLVGVSLLIGVEWLRPIDTITPSSSVMMRAPDAGPTRDVGAGGALESGAAISEVEDGGESVPAIITPPEPLLQPRGTTGTIPATETRPVARNEAPGVRSPVRRPASPAAETAVNAEIPDDYVGRPDVTRVENTPQPADPIVARAEITDLPEPIAASAAGTALSADERPAVNGPAVDAAPAALPAARVPAAVVAPPDRGGVEDVLRRYASAYRALDASAARAVWPSVDEKALARAFQNLASQHVSFDACDIDIRGAVANASCRGQASYVGKVGSREQRTEARSWQFELRRRGDGWLIEGVDARRLSASAAYPDR